jgi:hypothetical protein
VTQFSAYTDPFQSDFPEVIEEYLEHGVTKCISFNRRGTLLAGATHLFCYFMTGAKCLRVKIFNWRRRDSSRRLNIG